MNLKPLIELSAEGMKKTDASKVILKFLDELSDVLARGERVTLSGFGTFAVKNRAARDVKVPLTGEIKHVPARKAVLFKAAPALKAHIERFVTDAERK